MDVMCLNTKCVLNVPRGTGRQKIEFFCKRTEERVILEKYLLEFIGKYVNLFHRCIIKTVNKMKYSVIKKNTVNWKYN